MQFTKLTEEEQEVNAALDAHRDALRDEMQVMATGMILNIVGLGLLLFSPEDSSPSRIGFGLFLCSILCFIINFALGFRTRKYRNQAKPLVDAYMRKKALPFYQELTEMFADKQGIHLHLDERGTIVVTDRRKQGEGEING